MKKQHLILLFSALTLTSLVGCNKKQYDKTPLTFKNMSLTDVITLESEVDFVDKVENDNFLVVANADATCSCWALFHNDVLVPYIKQTGVEIYFIEANKLVSSYYGLPINAGKTNTPVFAIYEDGKVKHSSTYNYSNTIFSSLDAFTRYVDERVILPQVEIITLDKFNELLKSKEKFLVNYGLSFCPDCKAYDRMFLKDYLKTEVKRDIPYYYLETMAEGMRMLNGDPSTPEAKLQWSLFKDNYGLSDAKNTELGYATGFVPTVQLIEGDGTDHVASLDITPIIKDMMVFQNDQVAMVDGKAKIVDSFYDGVRGTSFYGPYDSLIGEELTEDKYTVNEETGAVRLVPLSRYDIHVKFAKKFLDVYWK
jgi:thiol-disulfide isomerase/thioredoxin